MPEYSEVKIVAEQMAKKILGCKLLKMETDGNSTYDKFNMKGSSKIKYPMICKQVYSKGKKIIMVFERCVMATTGSTGSSTVSTVTESTGTTSYFVSSLAMNGKWFFHKEGEHSNLWFTFESPENPNETFNMWFNDTRHFGKLEYYDNEEDLKKRMKVVGPNLIEDKITFDQWKAKLSNKRIKGMQIAHFFLSQNYFSGVGNYMKSEILYRAKIKPDRCLSTLSNEDMMALFNETIAVMKESYDYGGLTIKSYVSPSGERGNYQCKVYGKKKDPLGNPVLYSKFKDRGMTYWVSEVQK